MNATVTGAVGGIQSGDTITKIEIVWKSGSETEDQAMAAVPPRGVVLTAPADISAFQASGYALSSSALVQGQGYTPAVRVTESRNGVDGFVGPWKNGVAFTAQNANIVIADFNTTTMPPDLSLTAGAGVTYDSNTSNAGYLTVTASNADNFSLSNSALPASKVFTIKVKGRCDYAQAGPSFINISDPGGFYLGIYLTTSTTSGVSPTFNITFCQYKTSTSTWKSWKNSAWGAAAGFDMSNGEYVFQIESNGTQFRGTIFNSDGTTIAYQTTWVDYSLAYPITGQLKYTCDSGAGIAKMYIDYIHITTP